MIVSKSSVLCDVKLCSPLKINRRFGGTYRLSFRIGEEAFTLVFCLVYLSTLKIEAKYSSETSVEFQWTIWRITEDSTFRNHRCENLKFYSEICTTAVFYLLVRNLRIYKGGNGLILWERYANICRLMLFLPDPFWFAIHPSSYHWMSHTRISSAQRADWLDIDSHHS
jgi:hypothetical protein